MSIIQLNSTVGEDGVLSLRVPMGPEDANLEVVVTIRALAGDTEKPEKPVLDWDQFVQSTYGSCEGLGLERPPQGEFEIREQVG